MGKKICFITTIPGTLQSFVLDFAKYLHKNTDFDISFICDYDEKFAKDLPEYIHYFPVPMARGISLGGFGALLQIKKIMQREKFDLVQYSTPNAACYAALAAWMVGVPVRLYCQWGLAFVGMQGIKRSIFKTIEKMVCTLSTWIEPDSFGNLRFCHEQGLYPEWKGSVNWNGSASGVNLEKFDIAHKDEWRKEIRNKYDIPAAAKVFIFVGRVTRDKGINELFTAAKKLFEEYNDCYLLMVGNNENSGSVKQVLYTWSKEEPRLIYCGYTNTVEKYLAASDVYVLPSYREGFGSAVVEAEAMGVPVIVSDIPGPTDAMKKDETGLLVKKADSEDLYKAMQKLYNEPELVAKFGKNAYDFAKNNFEQQTLFGIMLEDRKKLLGLGK